MHICTHKCRFYWRDVSVKSNFKKYVHVNVLSPWKASSSSSLLLLLLLLSNTWHPLEVTNGFISTLSLSLSLQQKFRKSSLNCVFFEFFIQCVCETDFQYHLSAVTLKHITSSWCHERIHLFLSTTKIQKSKKIFS